MLSDQIKQVLTTNTTSFLAPRFSRKTTLLKKRNKALSSCSIEDIATYTQQKSSQQPQSKQLIVRSESQHNPITPIATPQQSNSVSCQTNTSLFDEQLPDIPASDPIWLEIIPQEVLQGSTVEQLLEDNKDYFYYLLGLYLQEQMHGDFNMNKFMLPTKWQSQYGRDFPLKQKERQEIIKNTVYEDYKSPQTSEFSKTSYKTHFSAYPPKDYNPKLERRKYEKSELQFATLTTYKANHFDFQSNFKPEKVTASKHLTTGGLSLSSQTLYKTEYQWPQPIEQPTNCKNIYSKLNPIQSSGIFFDKQRDVYNQFPIDPISKQTPYSQTPTYQKQYISTTKNDFQGVRLGEVTQMKNWRQSVIRRMNQLRKQSQI
ncbi:unnamed protein product [Paramecium pentaurelia]|uniref:Uncharacterized protein n=1 Tax=Paramecium pentaurelia TaxID=43138 RepID=A0A8S1Y0C4_9CILI|nr:unnamed protein product [Paramecium pentaurelia]